MQNTPKFSERLLKAKTKSPVITQKIKYLNNLDYFVKGKCDFKKDINKPIFTIILTISNGNTNYIYESINSVLSQTYENVEFILIDHGTTGEAKNLIDQTLKNNPNIVLIRVRKNTVDYSSKNVFDAVIRLWDAGLFASKGDYVYCLSYDDKLSNNYVEKMVDLFKKDSQCLTVAPRVVSINENSIINERNTNSLDARNRRLKYTEGLKLVESFINKGDQISAPGGVLAANSLLVINSGGFDLLNDFTQIIRFGVNGRSGYDPTASLFWRHHSKQNNKLCRIHGVITYYSTISIISTYEIYDLYQRIAGKNFAQVIINYFNQLAINGVYTDIRNCTKYSIFGGLRALVRIKNQCPNDIFIRSILIFIKCIAILPFENIFKIIIFIFGREARKKIRLFLFKNENI